MFSKRFQDLSDAVASCQYATQKPIEENEALDITFQIIAETRLKKGIIYVIGNGGSAGIASHFSTDLIKSLKIPSQTLFDSNLLTCLSNDLGYENCFSYPLSKLMKAEDLLFAISSSGKSRNILNAVESARVVNARVITLSGFDMENPLRKSGDLNFWIDRFDYGLVETAHFFILHTLIDLWNKRHAPVEEYAKIIRDSNTKQNQIAPGNC